MLDNTNTNTDAHLLYSTLPNIIIGFHGCDKEVFQKILYKHEPFKCSHNTYRLAWKWDVFLGTKFGTCVGMGKIR